MTLPQDKPHIAAGEAFKIKRKYDFFLIFPTFPVFLLKRLRF